MMPPRDHINLVEMADGLAKAGQVVLCEAYLGSGVCGGFAPLNGETINRVRNALREVEGEVGRLRAFLDVAETEAAAR